MFNPANTFDSQGLTQLTEQIEKERKREMILLKIQKFQLKIKI